LRDVGSGQLEGMWRPAATTVVVERYLETSTQVRWAKANRHAAIDNNQLLKYDGRVVASLPP